MHSLTPGSASAAATPPPPSVVNGARAADGGAGRSGGALVVGLVLLGVAAGVTGVLFQRAQTRRCLEFYGADAARKVAAAPAVEVWTLAPGDQPGNLVAVERLDISTARGLVHLRRGLVEDANFRWPTPESTPVEQRLPNSAWDTALVFSDPADDRPPVILVLDLDGLASVEGEHGEKGALAVVGRPGRIMLGRIAAGLGDWLQENR